MQNLILEETEQLTIIATKQQALQLIQKQVELVSNQAAQQHIVLQEEYVIKRQLNYKQELVLVIKQLLKPKEELVPATKQVPKHKKEQELVIKQLQNHKKERALVTKLAQ